MSDFYIHRELYHGQQLIRDGDLLGKSGVLVVLAEPGAGKSDLLDYLSRNLGVPREPAALFAHVPISPRSMLILDALDEVARTNEETTNEIIVKARTSGARTVILASRSYVWDEARNQTIRDCFGLDPMILRLEPFNEDEQRQLFEHDFPTEDFKAFQIEAERFELTPILGNPQFLQLLASAYVESGRRFNSKRQIYADALRGLASESKQTGAMRNRPSTEKIVAAASEVFAKLLLSGATGISAQEEIGDDNYPYLDSVGPHAGILTFALNTRLFKPTTSVNKHEPVHRIVAEYCAATFLAQRIEDPTNTLSIRRCLAIVAPNGAVRSELRGLLGWLASLGGRAIQEAVLDLDPYAVFANGDPSQLLPSSKSRLLTGLAALAKVDPYFRRMDGWRRFSVAGFFSGDTIEHVRPLLAPAYAESHLRGLLLELLQGSDRAVDLQSELCNILCDPAAELRERQLAWKILNGIPSYDVAVDFAELVKQGSTDSLHVASEMVAKRGTHLFGVGSTIELMEALARLYPTDRKGRRTIGSRYFIDRLIETFNANDIQRLLDHIAPHIVCVCGRSRAFECTCRIGISKIAGRLLDRYFQTLVGPHDPGRIAAWTMPLIFQGHVSAQRSASIEVLNDNHGLRRAIQLRAFAGLTTRDEISDAHLRFFMSYSHDGLIIQAEDLRSIVDYAVATGNVPLWEHFIACHSPYTSRKGVYELRAHMRTQARQSPGLLRIWSRVNRNHRQQMRDQHIRFGRRHRRHEQNEERRREHNFAHLRNNRAQIEAGRHWWWLQRFAYYYLYKDEKIEEIVDDPQTLEKALLNCFDFLAAHVPSLEMLAERRGTDIATVLQAASLATFRQTGSLQGIAFNVLQSIKADGVGGAGYEEGEAERFEAELDRLLFASDLDAIVFAKRYIEPQLTRAEDSVAQVHVLDRGAVFANVKGGMALHWLTRYPNMPVSARDSLFSIAAVHADRAKLDALVEARCNDALDPSEIGQNTRKFWLLRHFFFIVPTSHALWTEFSADPKSIFAIAHCTGRFPSRRAEGWPQLGGEQIYRILDAFSSVWPKVDLPSSYGSGDPEEETAYRFLTEVIYQIGRDDPSVSIAVFDRILSEARFTDFHTDIRSERAAALRKLALAGFRAPRPTEIARLVDQSKIASVEDMRALLVELLDEIQGRLKGAATDPVDVFYAGNTRVDENTARNRIVDMLEARLNALNLGVVVEHQMADAKRCDFTSSTSINGSQAVLVTEVKGQWNDELYTAASAQLASRYTIYPGAAEQGVYLVLWFGGAEAVAGKRTHSVTSPGDLRKSIVSSMPEGLLGRIDVFVLDVSRPHSAATTAAGKGRRRATRSRSSSS